MVNTIRPNKNKIELPYWLSSSGVLFISMTLVNGGNYLYNLLLGRWLGPAQFADLSLIVTLMLMVTFLTVTLQLTAAKFTATESAELIPSIHATLSRWAWSLGGVGLVLFGFGAPLWQQLFQTQTMWPFVLLAVGLPIYFVQGVDRGIRQGKMDFGRLAASYQIEMWVRLLVGLGLVALGTAVGGATLGITLSFFASWGVIRFTAPTKIAISAELRQKLITYILPVLFANLSQILINNSDVVLVKRFFSAELAGQYSALALIGRIVFFATWSIVTTLFPIVAQKQATKQAHYHLLWTGLGLVGSLGIIIIIICFWFPDWIVNILFGAAYQPIAPLLWLYAIATLLYALANVIITYRLSLNQKGSTVIAVGAGILQLVTISLWHGSLAQVVVVQIALMSLLLAMLLIQEGFYVRSGR